MQRSDSFFVLISEGTIQNGSFSYTLDHQCCGYFSRHPLRAWHFLQGGWLGIIWLALILGLANAFLRPLLKLLTIIKTRRRLPGFNPGR
jgi:hypothetical protein